MNKRLLCMGLALLVMIGIRGGCASSTSVPSETSAAPSTAASVYEETEAELLPPSSPPFSTVGWATDFSRRTVAWEEIISGGPPKDGIPAID